MEQDGVTVLLPPAVLLAVGGRGANGTRGTRARPVTGTVQGPAGLGLGSCCGRDLPRSSPQPAAAAELWARQGPPAASRA